MLSDVFFVEFSTVGALVDTARCQAYRCLGLLYLAFGLSNLVSRGRESCVMNGTVAGVGVR